MEKIGIREAKNSLTKYVRRVKRGEPFIITQRGVPVAKLTPLEATVPEKIGRLLETKMATWTGGKPGSRTPVPVKIHSGITLAELIEEDRR